MLTVSGVLFIPETPVEAKYQNGSYFKFTAIGKHPRKQEHVFYKVNIFVLEAKASRAREVLSEGKHIWIRTGELTGKKSKEGLVFNEVTTSWDKIELLNLALQPERQEDK